MRCVTRSVGLSSALVLLDGVVVGPDWRFAWRYPMPSLTLAVCLLISFVVLGSAPFAYVSVRTCLEPGAGRHRRGGGRHAARWSAR